MNEGKRSGFIVFLANHFREERTKLSRRERNELSGGARLGNERGGRGRSARFWVNRKGRSRHARRRGKGPEKLMQIHY